MGQTEHREQFRAVNPVLTGFILVSFFYLLPAISFWPEALPPSDVVNWLVQNYQFLVRTVFLLAIILHLFEAVFAMMICTYMDLEYNVTLKWGLNVFVNGVFALRHLLSKLFAYESEQRKQADLFAATSNNYHSHDNFYHPKVRRSSQEKRRSPSIESVKNNEKSI